MFKIRASKYRHVFCDEPKPELCWQGFLLSTVTGDQQYIKASSKYFAVALRGGGGPFAVCRHDRPGRFEPGTSQIVQGHTGAVLDFDWNPFDDSMVATGSEDTTIKIWGIPEDWEPTDAAGNSKKGQNLKESLVDLTGHRKKVTFLRFNPTAGNVIASASTDYSVKVWDIEKGEEISSFDQMGNLTQDVVWDFRGDNYATSCKDKIVRLMDGRTSTVSSTIEKAHEGSKSVKLVYLDNGKLLSTGFSRHSSREMKIWDLSNLSKPLSTEKLDNASGVIFPMYDRDSKILYLCGKGDGNIRPFEFEDRSPYVFRLNEGFRSKLSSKGICVIPKRGNNIMGCETARLLKVTNEQSVHPLSYIVPRKNDAFQDDIFPDCAAPEPAHTADEWLAGSSMDPVTMSLNPAINKGNIGGAKKVFKARTVAQVSSELKEANERIQYLEKKLTENGISF
eukprot:CAMPEP_0195519622 /NCGR_PEP_ID=MMETSP0794_2-20130614/15150_1 /TAXON_ID=515487 /ORGANISM="Stephanopyxis turris, Strain CCMP 815" /LENGTH=449 /DNA_ID=CAMNT_0040648807 /DNA_START=105 /DNA_END=1454 /DNA_ORIENTATION=+